VVDFGPSVAGCVGERAHASVSTPLPPRADRIRWADLSVQSTAILRQVIAPIHLEGSTATATAKRLGIPLASVRLLVAYFANEVSELEQA
jgi:hypothetical protein